MKHTKGPWKVWYSKESERMTVGNNEFVVCETYTDKQSLQDANLIAAAPEMLEALEHLEKELFPDEFVKHSKDSIRKLKDAIKKARGES